MPTTSGWKMRFAHSQSGKITFVKSCGSSPDARIFDTFFKAGASRKGDVQKVDPDVFMWEAHSFSPFFKTTDHILIEAMQSLSSRVATKAMRTPPLASKSDRDTDASYFPTIDVRIVHNGLVGVDEMADPAVAATFRMRRDSVAKCFFVFPTSW